MSSRKRKLDVSIKSSSSSSSSQKHSKLIQNVKEQKRPAGTTFSSFASLCESIEQEPGRLKTIKSVGEFLASLDPSDVIPTLYLLSNRIAPSYINTEIGVGTGIITSAIVQSGSLTLDKLRQKLKDVGDLGEVAMQSKKPQKTIGSFFTLVSSSKKTEPTIASVFKDLHKLSQTPSSNDKKSMIVGLLAQCDALSTKYIVRLLEGSLRVGLAERGVIASFAYSVVLDERRAIVDKNGEDVFGDEYKKTHEQIMDAYTCVPNYECLVEAISKFGVSALSRQCQLKAGIPVKVMLGRPLNSVEDMLKHLGDHPFMVDWKLDGCRCQLHRQRDGTVSLYSRNSENDTLKNPDVVSYFKLSEQFQNKEFIIDAEIVAYDRIKKQILPFQELSKRKRKDVQESEITVDVCIFAFDILLWDGKSLIDCHLKDRRKLLYREFAFDEGRLHFAKFMDIDPTKKEDIAQIKPFMDEAVKGYCEGLMIKPLEGPHGTYFPDKRYWFKLKKDYLASAAADSLDLVPIGAFYGKGKRSDTFGSFLLACYDADEDVYQCICKVGTGFNEDQLAEYSKQLSKIVSSKKSTSFITGKGPGHDCDVWFEPKIVWEIMCADMSISPVHKAAIGLVDESKGIALRFPRFIRERQDKQPEDCTSAQQVADMYRNQSNVN